MPLSGVGLSFFIRASCSSRNPTLMRDSTSSAKTLSRKEPSREDDHGEDGHGMEDERVELDVENAELEGRETLRYDDSSTTNGLLVEIFVVLTHYELRLIASNLFHWNTSPFFLMVKSVRI